jgi:hypothetical protein
MVLRALLPASLLLVAGLTRTAGESFEWTNAAIDLLEGETRALDRAAEELAHTDPRTALSWVEGRTLRLAAEALDAARRVTVVRETEALFVDVLSGDVDRLEERRATLDRELADAIGDLEALRQRAGEHARERAALRDRALPAFRRLAALRRARIEAARRRGVEVPADALLEAALTAHAAARMSREVPPEGR